MRRLLVVTYYFPPSGGAGVQRVLKWVKYLRDFGVEPAVLTVEAGAYPKYDETLWAEVPPGVEVRRTPSFDPYGAYARLTGRSREQAVAETAGHLAESPDWKERLAQWVRANVFIPDARVGWVPFAVRRGAQVLRSGRFDAVLTSGPPHSVHLTGLALHRLTGLPWVADFRDPWTDISYYDELPRTALARALDETLERTVLREATRITTISEAGKALFLGKVERAPGDLTVIENGFDPADFPEGPAPPGDRFVLAYVGSLYGSRSPEALWQALAGLRAQGVVPKLRLRLVGRIGDDVQATLRRHGLDAVTETVPYLPHDEAVREMQRATALLLTIEPYRHEHGTTTGKLYEYLAAGRPVVGSGPPDGAAAAILRAAGAGRMIDRDDAEGFAAHLRSLYEAWERGAMPQGASAEAAAPYSRRAQTGEVAALLDALASEAAS